jgi:hypothetical protein
MCSHYISTPSFLSSEVNETRFSKMLLGRMNAIALLCFIFAIQTATTLATAPTATVCKDEEAEMFPELCKILKMSQEFPELLSSHLSNSQFAALAPDNISSDQKLSPFLRHSSLRSPLSSNSALPIVVAHGMGDSCYNTPMVSLTSAMGARAGTYSVCVPTGDDQASDTINGFVMNMNANVDEFAKRVRNDPLLANGFNAVGLSQGNNVIRG